MSELSILEDTISLFNKNKGLTISEIEEIQKIGLTPTVEEADTLFLNGIKVSELTKLLESADNFSNKSYQILSDQIKASSGFQEAKITELNTQIRQTALETNEELKTLQTDVTNIQKNIKNINTQLEELNKSLKSSQNETIQESVQRTESIAKDGKVDESWFTKAKPWAKGFLIASGLTLIGLTVAEITKLYQKHCNGCWLVYTDQSSGNVTKCKLDNLTCIDSNDNRDDQACSKVATTIYANIIGASNPNNNPSGFEFCTDDDPDCKTPKTWNEMLTKDSSGIGISCPGDPNNYPNPNCSIFCQNAKKLVNNLGPSYQLKCINMNFLESLMDLAGSIPSPTDSFSNIVKYLEYGLIGIAGIFVFIILFKVIFYFVHK